MRVRFTRRAARELEGIFQHIAADDDAAAARVVVAIETFAALLAQHPGVGRPAPGRSARVSPVPRLPYLVLFRESDGELQILNVRHGRRRPFSP